MGVGWVWGGWVELAGGVSGSDERAEVCKVAALEGREGGEGGAVWEARAAGKSASGNALKGSSKTRTAIRSSRYLAKAHRI